MAEKGTSSRSGTPLKERPTSKACSVTVKSQYWCWRTMVMSSGYWANRRLEMRTPGARVARVMKK